MRWSRAVANPNAAVAGSTSGLSVALVWFLGNVWPHVALSAELGAVIAGAASASLLFVGRNGIAGLWNRILHGSNPPKDTP
jgi:hypothetical protein